MPRVSRRSFINILALTLIVTIPIPSLAAGKCFLWEIKSGNSTVYLLGSLHMAKPEMYPLNSAIEDAFKKSDAIVVEVNLGPGMEMAAISMILQNAMYTDGSTLSTKLSKNTFNKLSAWCKKKNQDINSLNMMKPWYVALMLITQETEDLGFSKESGIERYFINKAGTKPVFELETIAGQVALLASGSEQEQELALSEGLDQLPATKSILDRMINAWQNGDTAAMESVIKDNLPKSSQLQPQNKRFFDDRNIVMAKKIEEYLKANKTYFVIVGSGHLVGNKGIVKLLQSKGLSVNQINKR